MSRYSILGCYGEGNLGDEAILAGLKHLIKQSDQDATFNIYIGSESFASSYTDNAVLDLNLVKVKSWYGLFVKGKIIDIIKAMANSDVFIIGGGELIRDDFGVMPILSIFEKAMMAKLFRNKLVLLGVGIGKLDTKYGKLLTKLLISMAETVIVRDHNSREILQTLQPKYQIISASDVAFTLPSVRTGNILINKKLIAVSLRDWPSAWTSKTISKDKQIYLYDMFIKELSATIKLLHDTHDYEFLFIPFRIENGDDDRVAINELIEMSKITNYKIYKYSADPYNVKKTISQCKLLIGMRLHACILAISEGIPTLAINYDNKVTKLMSDVDMDKFILDIFNADRKVYYQKILDCLEAVPNDIMCKSNHNINETQKIYANRLKQLKKGN